MRSLNARLKKLRRLIIDNMTPEQREQNKDFVNDRRHLPFGEKLAALEKLIAEHRNSNAGQSGKGKK